LQDDDAAEYSEGVLEAMLGRALPLLQDAANFAGRINAVVKNLIQQMASLLSKVGDQLAFQPQQQ
jgi:hypothetical protein